MFRDRATQFKTRLKWDVTVDAQGFEKDEYDALDPLYVIWENQAGRHAGSMRLLPSTGRTMAEGERVMIVRDGSTEWFENDVGSWLHRGPLVAEADIVGLATLYYFSVYGKAFDVRMPLTEYAACRMPAAVHRGFDVNVCSIR